MYIITDYQMQQLLNDSNCGRKEVLAEIKRQPLSDVGVDYKELDLNSEENNVNKNKFNNNEENKIRTV